MKTSLLKTLKKIIRRTPASLLVTAIVMTMGSVVTLSTDLYAAKFDKAHSQAQFKIKYLLVGELDGKFNDYNAKLEVDGKKIGSFEASAVVKSVDTGNKKRDSHLLENDYFGAKKHPDINLKMVSINGNQMETDLTIRGITKRVTFTSEFSTAKDPRTGKDVAGLVLNGDINRKDFDVGKKYPNASISETVNIGLSFLFRL
ncbi:protein YceI [Spirochaetota bacterium]|nr:protein YceI [Spirochaetota bacterium]